MTSFWEKHPTLIYSIAILLALYLEFSLFPLIFVVIPLGILAFRHSRQLQLQLALALFVGITAYFYIYAHYNFQELPEQGSTGTARFNIASVTQKRTAFGNAYLYQGKLHSFVPDSPEEENHSHGIPLTIQLTAKEGMERPPATHEYLIHGSLRVAGDHRYSLSPNKDEPWIPLRSKSWGFSEKRFQYKLQVKNYIHEKIFHPQAASFLSGIATGDFDDRSLQHEFGRFGLQHILAISGFHFGMIAGTLGFLLRFILSRSKAFVVLITMMTLYFLFLGITGSIIRSWITICVVLLGYLINKKSDSLNTLGLAFMAIFIIDPLLCRSLGFQLSFMCTASILFFFSPCDMILQQMWQKRHLSFVVRMNKFNQHGFICLTIVRQIIALTIAVHITAIPLTLFYFSKFPLLGLIYNLFFPFLVSISMLFLLVAFLFDLFIPMIGSVIHAFNSHYSQTMINLTFNMPKSLDIYIRAYEIPSSFMVMYFCFLLWVGIALTHYVENKQLERQDFVFL